MIFTIKNDVLKKVVELDKNVVENKVLFTLIALANNDNKVNIDFYTLKRILNMPFYANKRLTEKLAKVQTMNIVNFTVSNNEIKINDDRFLAENIQNNFTKLDLDTLLHVKHTRAFKAFLLLSRFAQTGFYTVNFDEFKSMMNCKKYNLYQIKKEVVNIIEKEIAPYCSHFSVELTRNRFKKGNPVKTISFIFTVNNHQKVFDGGYNVVDTFFHESLIKESEFCSSNIEKTQEKTSENKVIKHKKAYDKFKNKVANSCYKSRKKFVEIIPEWMQSQTNNVNQKSQAKQKNIDVLNNIEVLKAKINAKTLAIS